MRRDDQDGVVRGIVYRPLGDLVISLREQPIAARGISGFDPFAIMVRGRADIDHWVSRLNRLGVAHSDVVDAPIGFIVSFDDPDGLQLRFYTLDTNGLDLEGRPRP